MAHMESLPSHDVEGVQKATAVFLKSFPLIEPTFAVAAPGRVDLIGEHVEHSNGFAMSLALTRSTYIVAKKLTQTTDTCQVASSFVDGAVAVFKIRRGLSRMDMMLEKHRWANLVMGMSAFYMDEGHEVAPFAAAIWSNVPIGAGLSSSAALQMAVGKLLEVMNGLNVTPESRATIAQRCEHTFRGVNCGIIGQLVSSCGKMDHALFIEFCKPPRIVDVPIVTQDAAIVIADTRVKHNLGDPVYRKRMKECEEARVAMQVESLRHATMEQLEAVRDHLKPDTFRRAKHAIAENDRTEKARDAFCRGDLATFGDLMNKSHASLRDDYEVSCKELNALVDIAGRVEGVYGSRMTGGGFGGCTVTLVRKDAVENLLAAFENEYSQEMSAEEDENGVEEDENDVEEDKSDVEEDENDVEEDKSDVEEDENDVEEDKSDVEEDENDGEAQWFQTTAGAGARDLTSLLLNVSFECEDL